MRKNIFIIAFLGLISTLFSQVFSIDRTDGSGLQFTVSVPVLEITPDGDFVHLRLDGAGYSKSIGKPQMPVFRKLIQIPMDGEITTSV
ncbi:hypothetical protein DRQ26_02880, partial [bacterium]